MNNIEEIKNQCENVKEEIKRLTKEFEGLQKIVSEYKDSGRVKRWIPHLNEKYYFIGDSGCIILTSFDNSYVDKQLIAFFNVFKTREEAEYEVRRQKIEKQIRWIAWELNGGFHIDAEWWIASRYHLRLETVFCLTLNFYKNHFVTLNIQNPKCFVMSQGTVYCLSKKFLEVIKEEVTDEDFKFYFGVDK